MSEFGFPLTAQSERMWECFYLPDDDDVEIELITPFDDVGDVTRAVLGGLALAARWWRSHLLLRL